MTGASQISSVAREMLASRERRLRDEMAMFALMGLPHLAPGMEWSVTEAARDAYAVADAMMAERSRRDGQPEVAA